MLKSQAPIEFFITIANERGSLQPAQVTKAQQDFTVSNVERQLNSHLTDLESTKVRWSSQEALTKHL